MKQACIFVAVLLFISTENCNGSVLKNLNEDYRRADELKKPAVIDGKVKGQNDHFKERLIFLYIILVETFRRFGKFC